MGHLGDLDLPAALASGTRFPDLLGVHRRSRQRVNPCRRTERFQVYRGNLPPLQVPLAFTAIPQPGGNKRMFGRSLAPPYTGPDMHAYALHLEQPQGRGRTPTDAFTGAAGGAACGDLIRVSVALGDGERVTDAGFDAAGCGAVIAAGSAAVSLVRGAGLLEAARVGAEEIAAELGGLSPGKRSKDVSEDALYLASQQK